MEKEAHVDRSSALKKYRQTPKGVLTNMYDHMRKRHYVDFSLAEFHKRFLDDARFKRLFAEWVNSAFSKLKKPSLDRINCKKPYTVANTHMLTWAENRYKQIMERRARKPRVLQIKDGVIVAIYKSQREAVRKIGANQGLMSMVLTGKRNKTCGFYFQYETPELLEQPPARKE